MTVDDSFPQAQVPIWIKLTLSYEDAAKYSGIGEERLRALAQRNPDLVLHIGNHSRIKRNKLEQFVQDSSYI